jgi:ACDE family multidrug resistance protein
MTISYVTLIFFEQLVLFIGILALSSIGTGIVLPCINSLITGAVGKERRAFVTSLYGSVRFLGVAIGPPIFGRLMEWSRTGMFLSIAGLTLLVGILALTMIHVKKNDEESAGKEKTPVTGKPLQPAEET